MRVQKLEHRFVRSVPRELEPGILYVSMDYGTAVHSCCCGCGEQIVTPFSPTAWKMLYDGESVSLTPSVGNWQLACRSHYVISQGRVIEAGNWSKAQVEAEHLRDKKAKARFYHDKTVTESVPDIRPHTPATVVSKPTLHEQHTEGFWSSIASWLFGRSSDKDK